MLPHSQASVGASTARIAQHQNSKDAQAQLPSHKAAQGGVVSQAHRQQQQRKCRQHPDQGRDAVSLRRGCHTRSGRVLQLLPVCGVLRRRRRRPWRRIITVCGRAGQHENGGAVSCRCDLLMRWRRAHSWGGRRLHISSGSAEAPLPQPATHTRTQSASAQRPWPRQPGTCPAPAGRRDTRNI